MPLQNDWAIRDSCHGQPMVDVLVVFSLRFPYTKYVLRRNEERRLKAQGDILRNSYCCQ